MNKLMLSLVVALFAVVATDAFARCGYKACNKVSYATECPKACRVDRVIESPCPAVPCCTRYVKVEEPALITKHISYSVECPSNCTAEMKNAGMLQAGQSINFEQEQAAGY